MNDLRRRARRAGLLLLLGGAGCLEPLVSDEVPGAGLLLPADTDPASVRHVEDDPTRAPKAAAFTTRVDYLKGFAAGRPVWYWNADGPVVELLAPLYVVIGADGRESTPIIDALPGEPGYSPWWRRIEVRATAAYQGELLTSRAAIEAALDAGLVEAPVATTRIVTAVVVRRALAPVAVGNGLSVAPTRAYYKGQQVSWVEFSHTVERPLEQNELEVLPVYVLQRIDESEPLYEVAAGRDLNGDGQINASNNIFARDTSDPDYTPLWVSTTARVAADVRSIDTSSATPELVREADVADGTGPRGPRVLSLTSTGRLVNCPIQVTKGAL